MTRIKDQAYDLVLVDNAYREMKPEKMAYLRLTTRLVFTQSITKGQVQYRLYRPADGVTID